MTGKPAGHMVTMVNAPVLAALDFTMVQGYHILKGDDLIKAIKNSTGPQETPFYDGDIRKHGCNILVPEDIVYLRPEHVTYSTGLMRMHLRAHTHYASFVTNIGWLQSIDVDIVVPEDMSVKHFKDWVISTLTNVKFAPLYNTGGWEAVSELPAKAWERWVGNLRATENFFSIPVGEFSTLTPHLTAHVSFQPVKDTELEYLDKLSCTYSAEQRLEDLYDQMLQRHIHRYELTQTDGLLKTMQAPYVRTLVAGSLYNSGYLVKQSDRMIGCDNPTEWQLVQLFDRKVQMPLCKQLGLEFDPTDYDQKVQVIKEFVKLSAADFRAMMIRHQFGSIE
jgi:hypothetical protein